MRRISLILCLAVAAGCAEPGPVASPPDEPPAAVETQAATLSLSEVARSDGRVSVAVRFDKRAEQGPRVAELWLRGSDGLRYLGAQEGSAATAAGKRLIVQEQPDGLRVILVSTSNTHRIDSGELARLDFELGAGEHQLELLPRMPIFAPADSNQGLTLGEPLTIRGGGRE